MPFQHLPASIRSLKARLRTLAKPSLWGSILGVSLILPLGWEYARQLGQQETAVPESQSEPEITSELPALSPEDSQVAADIESSDVLSQLFSQEGQPLPPLAPNSQSYQNENPGFFDGVSSNGIDTTAVLERFSVSPPPTEPTYSDPNPWGNPLVEFSESSVPETPGNNNPTWFAPSNSSTSTPPPNLLKSALEASSATSSDTNTIESPNPGNFQSAIEVPQTSPSTSQGFDRFWSPELTQPIPSKTGGIQRTSSDPRRTVPGNSNPYNLNSNPSLTPPQPQNSYPYPGTPSTVPGVSSVSPLPTNPNVAPGSYNYEVPAYNYPGTVTQQTNPYQTPTTSLQSPYPTPESVELELPEQPPFTVETPIPGRYLGGGEINTFANP